MLYIMSMAVCVSSDSKSHLYAWRTKPSLVKRAIGQKKELFLQHGVTALKQVHQLFGKKGTSSMEYFVTTGRVEQEIAINELGYNEKQRLLQVLQGGMCLKISKVIRKSSFSLCLLGARGLKR